jgi:predicted amidohydrolase YtcJ
VNARRIVLFAAVLALAGCPAAPPPGSNAPTDRPPPAAPARREEAELVLRGGTIFTMDPAHPRARDVAIAGGRFVYVGDDASAFVGSRTRVIELGGSPAVPSLTDAHAHLVGLGESLARVDLEGCTSADDCAARVRKWATEHPSASAAPADGWVRGRGWDQNRFADKRFPEHAALDRAVPDRPVVLRRIDGHAAWANARALALAGIDRKMADPAGGKIIRDRAGDPTGVFVDNAVDLLERVLPPTSDAERAQAILRAQEVALEHGLTEVHEMGIDGKTTAVYRQLAREQKLKIRIYAFRSASELDAVLESKPDPPSAHGFFVVRGIKLYADGALGSRGAALLAPYTDEKDNVGLFVMPAEGIEAAARKALVRGWQLAIHAIGDRANRSVLDAFEHAGCASTADHRFRIEHAQILSRGDIPRFKALGVIASMQPKHATSDMPWAEARLGKDRLSGAYAFRSLLESGARTAWGSDFPVEGVSVIEGIHAATTRTDVAGKPEGGWTPAERLSLDQALRGFSEGAAYAAFEESWRGRAAVGLAADLSVFDRDLADPAALPKARARLTIVEGRVMFERR